MYPDMFDSTCGVISLIPGITTSKRKMTIDHKNKQPNEKKVKSDIDVSFNSLEVPSKLTTEIVPKDKITTTPTSVKNESTMAFDSFFEAYPEFKVYKKKFENDEIYTLEILKKVKIDDFTELGVKIGRRICLFIAIDEFTQALKNSNSK